MAPSSQIHDILQYMPTATAENTFIQQLRILIRLTPTGGDLIVKHNNQVIKCSTFKYIPVNEMLNEIVSHNIILLWFSLDKT